MNSRCGSGLVAVALGALLMMGSAGCVDDSPDGGAEAGLCGEGEAFEYGGETFCVYDGEILEEGFNCPAEMVRQDFDDFSACGPQEGFDAGFEEAAREFREGAGNNGDVSNGEDNRPVGGEDCGGLEVARCDADPDCRYVYPHSFRIHDPGRVRRSCSRQDVWRV